MKSIVTIRRPEIDHNNLSCVIVRQSKALVLCAYINDFVVDGYIVMSKKWITAKEVRESDGYYTDIMRREGKLPLKPDKSHKVNIVSWKSVCDCLVGKVVAIEEESKGNYWLGPILSADESAVSIRHYDGCGNRIKDQTVQYTRITRINIDDRYIKTFKKYLK